MTVKKSLTAVMLSAILSVCALPAVNSAVFTSSASAEADSQAVRDYNKYYYGQLKTARAKKLYDALDGLDKSHGNASLNLIESEVLTSAETEKYAVDGDSKLMLDFGAARDAYALDHPEVFYADIQRIALSVEKRNGNYFAVLGTGREDSYYLRGTDGTLGFGSASEVESARTALENELKNYDKYSGQSPENIVKGVNKDIAESTAYGFGCSYNTELQKTEYTDAEPFVHTAYGALVCGESAGDGYAKAFKVIMDRLGVPCVLVQGEIFSDPASGAGQRHAWNCVQIDGKWFAVDVAANDGLYSYEAEKYLLLGEGGISADHSANGVISSVGYEFAYPELCAYNYGGNQSDGTVNTQKNYDCTAVYGGNKLYNQPYGAPQAVGSEISVSGWTYSENGQTKYFAEGQRSLLMLVSSKPSESERISVESRLGEKLGGVALQASLYNITAYICGKRVASNSPIQVGFGFPAGYGRDSSGVTYRVYGYSVNNGSISDIKELPCVATPYGVIAEVQNFGSVAVVAVDKSSSSAKNIYAVSAGNGLIEAADGSQSAQSIYSLVSGSVKYTFAPADGYQLDYVLLNGEIKQTEGNAAELTYAELNGANTLEAHFVANGVKQREESEGITNTVPPEIIFDPMGEISVALVCVEEKGGGYTLTASHSIAENYVTGKVRYEWYKDGELITVNDGEAYSGTTLSVKDGKKGEYSVKAVYEYSGRTKTAQTKAVKTGGSDSVWIIAASVVSAVVVIAAIVVMAVLHFRKKKK